MERIYGEVTVERDGSDIVVAVSPWLAAAMCVSPCERFHTSHEGSVQFTMDMLQYVSATYPWVSISGELS